MTRETEGVVQHAAVLRWVTRAAVGTAVTLIVVKIVAWILTDSIALLSSLVDSILDCLASAVNLLAIHHALQPADMEHRFGHGKAEPLAGLAQAAFIGGSAVFLVIQVIGRLVQPIEVRQEMTGIFVMAFSIAATMALVMFQKFVIRRTRSVAISADRLHYVGDIAINASVILSLVLYKVFGWRFVDPLFGLGISAYLLLNAYGVARMSLDLLMDREVPDEDRARIVGIVRSFPRVYDIHDLRTRSTGSLQFIQFHLELEKTLPLWEAHAITEEVIRAIRDAFPQAEVIVHQDPADVREDEHTSLSYRDRLHGEPTLSAFSPSGPGGDAP